MGNVLKPTTLSHTYHQSSCYSFSYYFTYGYVCHIQWTQFPMYFFLSMILDIQSQGIQLWNTILKYLSIPCETCSYVLIRWYGFSEFDC